MSVPLEIIAGRTTYRHFAERTNDLYAPAEFVTAAGNGVSSSSAPLDQTWRYCVAKAQGGAVYFANKSSGASVWILPDVHALPGEPTEPSAMTTNGTVDSASATQSRFGITRSVTAAVSDSAPGSRSQTPFTEAPAAAVTTNLTTNNNNNNNHSITVTATTATDVRKSLQEKLQETLRQRMASRNGASGSAAAPLEGAPVTDQMKPLSTPVHPPRPTPAATAASGDSTTTADTMIASPIQPGDVRTPIAQTSSRVASGSPGSVRDRIAQFRARGGAASSRTGSSRPMTPQGGSQLKDDGMEGAAGNTMMAAATTTASAADQLQMTTTSFRGESPTVAVDDAAQISPELQRPQPRPRAAQPSSRVERPPPASTGMAPSVVATPTLSVTPAELPQPQQQSDLQLDIYEEKRRQMLQADAELQQRRAELVRLEQEATAQSKRVLESRRQEEELHLKLVTQRREMEERRLQLEQDELKKLAEYAAKLEADAAARAAAESINQYEAAVEDAKRREEAAAQRAKSFSEAIAKSLLEEAPNVSTTSAAMSSQRRRRRGTQAVPFGGRGRDTDPALHSSSSSASSLSSSDFDESSSQPRRRSGVDEPEVEEDVATSAVNLSRYSRTTLAKGRSPSAATTDGATSRKAQHRIVYSPHVQYNGTIGGGPRAGPSSKYPVRWGRGQLTVSQGPHGPAQYDGKWKKDQKHGKGLMETASSIYEGDWRCDKPHGRGMLQTKTMKASVEVVKGTAEGAIIAQLSSGDTVVGKVSSNKVTAPAAVQLASGDHIEWYQRPTSVEDCVDARVQFANGDAYVGGIRRNRLHGKGAFLFAEGDEYVGDYVNGVMHGDGVLTFANGNVYDGQFRNGTFEGKGLYHCVGLYVYEGEWLDGAMHGTGRLSYANGDVWVGQLEKDERKQGRYVASTMFQI